ncbi:MAG: cell division protein FtsZ [Chthoniobacteraceae bacterium]|nr:cell division protein FtsZ [Chthoniobacteraceae bacterium]
MIELTSRSGSAPARNISIIGIGGAGANALDRMALDGVAPARLIAAHTDAQVLAASVAGRKIQLGQTVARGLGSGGDPEVGRCAAEESAAELRSALEGAETVFVLAGLGGGTGSGAAPYVAELAREAGALVIAIVTLPFSFEGKRRQAQAAEALAALQEQADAILCFENGRMGDAVAPRAGIQTAFAAADETLSQSVRALSGLLGRTGLIHLGFDDLAAALRDVPPRSLFGYGEAEGDNRAFDALAQALKNPFMDKGRLLRDCETVLVQVSGGPDLMLDEVQLLMEELNRSLSDQARLLFGAAVAPELAGRLTVTVLSSLGEAQTAAAPAPVVTAPAPVVAVPAPAPVAPQPAPAEPVLEEKAAVAEVAPKIPAAPAPVAAPEPVTESVPVPAAPRIHKPRGLRVAAQQASLFGDEPFAPIERVAPPVPGRMLHRPFPERPAPEPEPVAAVEPVVEPEPAAVVEPVAVPEPEPEAPAVVASVSEPEEEAAPAEEPVPEFFAEPVPELEMESEPEPAFEPEAVAEPEPPVVPEPPPQPAPVARAPFRRPERRTPLRPTEAGAAEPAAAAPGPGAKAPLQEVMQFEPVTRGRFEKSEPTIVDGQDLDVPAYLRHRIKLR